MGDPGPAFAFHAATPEGEGGIALVEVYGEGAAAVLEGLFRPRYGRMPRGGAVRLGWFTDGEGEEIDEVLLASVPAAASWCRLPGFTISCHGGAIIQRRLRSILARRGGQEKDRSGIVELARSRGAIDSIQGEALLLLPGARTARAARYLLRMSGGELSGRIRDVGGSLRRGDLPAARREIESLLAASGPAIRLLEPRRILIAGRPNAGKSSLLNRLAGRERAAVTPVAGTTRDLIEETVAIEGYPVVFLDGSGLRAPGETEDPVELEGLRRAREAAGDLVLFLIDRPGPPDAVEAGFLGGVRPERSLIVRTKADLLAGGGRPPAAGREFGWISSRTGEGLGALRERIREEWLGPREDAELPPAPFTDRQAAAVRRCLETSTIDGCHGALVECFPDLLGAVGEGPVAESPGGRVPDRL